jgi:hypothetical protein
MFYWQKFPVLVNSTCATSSKTEKLLLFAEIIPVDKFPAEALSPNVYLHEKIHIQIKRICRLFMTMKENNYYCILKKEIAEIILYSLNAPGRCRHFLIMKN